MGRFIQKFRYTNPEKKSIQSSISRSTGLFKGDVFVFIINLDLVFIRALLWVMSLISAGGDVLPMHDI